MNFIAVGSILMLSPKTAIKAFFIISILLIFPLLHLSAEDEGKQPEFIIMDNPVACKSLVDSCQIVALINKLEWEKVDTRGSYVAMNFLKRDAELSKDWQGVGAYDSSVWDEKNNTLRHVFLYGNGRNSAHEVWITYKLTQTGFEKPSIGVLGW